MFEILQDFEAASSYFNAAVLVLPGLILVAVGLFVWLGGLGFRTVLAALVGATMGGVCGFMVSGGSITATGISAAAVATIAAFFNKIFITIAGVILIAIVGVIIFTATSSKSSPAHASTKSSEMLTVSQTIEKIKQYAKDFTAETKKTCLNLPPQKWAIIIVVAMIFVIAAIFISGLTSALSCSAMGSLIILSGMTLLLLYKGSNPISCIIAKQSYYGTVLAVMTGVGTVSQLLFCQIPNKKAKPKKDSNSKKDKES